MAQCSLCGKEDLCFTCPYCNGVFCAEHRLPESHGCAGIQLVKAQARQKVAGQMASPAGAFPIRKPAPRRAIIHGQPPRRYPRFSSTEIRHLLIASVLVVLVSISILGRGSGGIIGGFAKVVELVGLGYGWYPAVLIGGFLLSFMVHEMAHKFTAQHYGLWSEFRMTNQGYYLSLIAILFSFPIFGTGAVFSSGSATQDQDGKINLSGPLSNAILAILAIAIAGGLAAAGLLNYYASWGASYIVQLNAYLGLFNMIPFEPFDGATVMRWDRNKWIVMVVVLVVLLAVGYVGIPAMTG